MDALRRAEADKKTAAARRDELSIDLPDTSGELSLEPLDVSTERPLRTLGLEDGSYDAQAAPTVQQTPRGPRDARPPEAGPFVTTPVGPGSAVQPTLVTAQTVFEASRGSGVPRALVALIASTVLIAAGLAAVGLYAYRQVPPARTIPSPRIAAEIEAPPAPTLPATVLPTPVDATATAAPPAVPPAAPPDAATSLPPAPAEAQVAAPPEPAPVEGPRPPAAAPPAAAARPVTAPPLERALAAEIPRDAEIASGEVRIARRSTGGAQVDEVTRAYAAFQLGKFDVATDLYRRALGRDPGRVDALLGLAAIAMRENRIAEAHRLYRDVLATAPRHPVASAALFMLEGGDGNEATEARLKLLADQEADSPYLRFALGNLYAKQKRWTDAQEAYFAAYAQAPTNADYAYNLAVSLDQLGQRKAALEYYRKALALRAPGAAFDPARAHARVAALLGAP